MLRGWIGGEEWALAILGSPGLLRPAVMLSSFGWGLGNDAGLVIPGASTPVT